MPLKTSHGLLIRIKETEVDPPVQKPAQSTSEIKHNETCQTLYEQSVKPKKLIDKGFFYSHNPSQ